MLSAINDTHDLQYARAPAVGAGPVTRMRRRSDECIRNAPNNPHLQVAVSATNRSIQTHAYGARYGALRASAAPYNEYFHDLSADYAGARTCYFSFPRSETVKVLAPSPLFWGDCRGEG